MLQPLPLARADNVFAAPIPGRRAEQLSLKGQFVEAGPAPEAMDEVLVCSCCSPGDV